MKVIITGEVNIGKFTITIPNLSRQYRQSFFPCQEYFPSTKNLNIISAQNSAS